MFVKTSQFETDRWVPVPMIDDEHYAQGYIGGEACQQVLGPILDPIEGKYGLFGTDVAFPDEGILLFAGDGYIQLLCQHIQRIKPRIVTGVGILLPRVAQTDDEIHTASSFRLFLKGSNFFLCRLRLFYRDSRQHRAQLPLIEGMLFCRNGSFIRLR